MQVNPANLSPKELKLQWTNAIVHFHDIICKCDKPLEHTIYNICDQEKNLRFNKETKKIIQQCVSTEDGDGAADALDIIDGGALDDLFAEDFTEDDG